MRIILKIFFTICFILFVVFVERMIVHNFEAEQVKTAIGQLDQSDFGLLAYDGFYLLGFATIVVFVLIVWRKEIKSIFP